jgi:hypothetical protein
MRSAAKAEQKAADYAAKKASGMIDETVSDVVEAAYKDGTKLFIPKQEGGIAETAKS